MSGTPKLVTPIKPPAPRPCDTCPYRRDCPSGVWATEEYEKLKAYDWPTWAQPTQVFLCHEHGEEAPGARACAGWAGCHDGPRLLSVRLALVTGAMTADHYRATIEYVSPVPLFSTGLAAASHGLRDVENLSREGLRATARLELRRRARGGSRRR